MAYWGAQDAYTALTARGVAFNLSVVTRNGKTAQDVARKQGHREFAAALMEPEPEPEPEVVIQLWVKTQDGGTLHVTADDGLATTVAQIRAKVAEEGAGLAPIGLVNLDQEVRSSYALR